MNFYHHPQYREFERAIWDHWNRKASVLVVTVSGMSENFFAKKFSQRWKKKGVTLVDSVNQRIGRFTVLMVDAASDEHELEMVDTYLRSAALDQKFAVVVNNPSIVETEQFRRSYTSKHVYGTYYLRALPEDMMKIFASELGVSLSKTDLSRVYRLTGGVARWIKWLMVHRDRLGDTPQELLRNEEFLQVLEPTMTLIGVCSDAVLAKLGLEENDHWNGAIADEYFQHHPRQPSFAIAINPDLRVTEKGRVSDQCLTALEKSILESMIARDGVITKDQVADLKYGAGRYDRFSDQAINKAMRRLDEKLDMYRIATIPKFGFKIEEERHGVT